MELTYTLRMRKSVILATALLIAWTATAQEQTSSSSVTLTLDHYDRLRRTSEAPSATVIDTILLGGSFREKNITIAFSGRTTGTRPLVKALDQTNDVTISACKGDAIVSRSGKGTFDLIPLADSFDVRCELRISGSDRLRMHVTSNVLAVRSSVSDGELVTGDEDDSGARHYTLVRHVAGPGETLAATATGRYLVTLLPDATRFRYSIDVHNPNRTTSTLELALQSNEHLQQIDSAAPYEVDGARYVFSIPPGDSAITMTGELRGTSFVAPVRASLQYLVLESHPLLRPTVKTPAKRISLAETGVTPQYRGAIALEAGTARIEWQVTRLEALHAISYAVTQASHTLFIPADGPVLGETTFALRNEGAAELVLPPKPEPTYVSLGNEPVLMTKNAAGQLTVPLSPGEQQALVQHRQPLPRRLGFLAGAVTIPQLAVPATTTSVQLSYPRQWVPLFESFASRGRVWTPDGGPLALFLFLAIWIERILAWLGARRRFLLALLIALAATLVITFQVLVIIALAALTILWITTQPTRRQKLIYGGVAVAIGFIVLLAYVGSTPKSYRYEMGSQAADVARTVVTDTMTTDAATPAPPQPAYQGLPAKFTLPRGARWTAFSEELLRTDRVQQASIVAVSLTLIKLIGFALALVALLFVWRDYGDLRDAIRARIAASRTPPLDVTPDAAAAP